MINLNNSEKEKKRKIKVGQMWMDYWEGGKEEECYIGGEEEERWRDEREVKKCHDGCVEEEAECRVDIWVTDFHGEEEDERLKESYPKQINLYFIT